MLLKIAGDNSSLKKACAAASENLSTLGEAAKKAGQVAATALTGIGAAAAGIATAATSAYTEHEKAANSLAAAVAVYYYSESRAVSYQTPLFWFVVIMMGCVGLFYLFRKSIADKPERLFAILALSTGLLLCIFAPLMTGVAWDVGQKSPVLPKPFLPIFHSIQNQAYHLFPPIQTCGWHLPHKNPFLPVHRQGSSLSRCIPFSAMLP